MEGITDIVAKHIRDIGAVLDCKETLNRYGSLKSQQKQRLITAIDRFLIRAPECVDLAAVMEIVLGLYPESAALMGRILQRRRRSHDYEVHFQFFYVLSHIENIPLELRRYCLSLVERYLNNIDRETAKSAYMAGDLLGCHWHANEATPVLTRVARQGKYAVGREWAVYGLERLASRTQSARRLSQVKSLLSHIAVNDRSKSVRHSAEIAVPLSRYS